MLKNRLIAVILINDGFVVQSVGFKHTNAIHYDPVIAIDSFNGWAVDEIVVLNVSRDENSKEDFLKTIQKISNSCFVPLSAGGYIKDVAYAKKLIANGADKIIVNTQAVNEPQLITSLAESLGSQCVIVSLDVKKNEEGKVIVAIDRGRVLTDLNPLQWIREAEKLGAGEIFINSIDHDGLRKGYFIELYKQISSIINIPLIVMGGVFTWEHLAEGIDIIDAQAVAAANIFHYTEHSTKKAKQYLLNKGLNFRKI